MAINEPPDLKILGFELWVHGRQFPDALDAWDGNWLRITAEVEAPGARVTVTGAVLDTVSFSVFSEALRRLQSTMFGDATLESHEPNIKVVVSAADRIGHLAIVIEITPDHLTQQHRIEFEADQTFLGPMIKQSDAILSRLPVREPSERGV
jgi:hypothetical protein